MEPEKTSMLSTPKTTKPELLEFLDKEIEDIQNELTQPGWTNWAIMVGIATTTWFLYSEIEIGKYDLNNALVLILIYSLSSPFIAFIVRVLNSLPLTPYSTSNRFFYTKETKTSLSIFLNLILVISGGLITNYISTGGMQLHEIISYTFHGVMILVGILNLLISRTKTPMPSDRELNSPKAKKMLNFIFIFSLLPLMAAMIYLYPLVIEQSKITISDIKISSLALATFILIQLLARTPSKTHILEALRRINRDLSLDRINPETAKKQIDIAINGLRSRDILQQKIDKYLTVMTQFDLEIEQVRQKILTRNRLSKGSEITDKSLQKEIVGQLEKLDKILSAEIPKHILPLSYQIVELIAMSKFSSSYIKTKDELIGALNVIKNRIKLGFDELQRIKENQGIPITKIEPPIIKRIEKIINSVKIG